MATPEARQVKVWGNPSRGKLQVEENLQAAEAIELHWTDSQGKKLESWTSKEVKQ